MAATNYPQRHPLTECIGIWRSYLVRGPSNWAHLLILYHYGKKRILLLPGHSFISIILQQVISSIIAAWSDISHALDDTWTPQDPAAAIGGLHAVQSAIAHVNVGYFWMFLNCITSAAFVSIRNTRFIFFSRNLSSFFKSC